MALAVQGLVEVRPCPHGRGLFASREMKKGFVIRRFEPLVLTSRPAMYALQIGENEYWDGFPRGSPDYWSNFIDHSADPNAVFIFDRGKTWALLKASRRIEKGTEIFIKYDHYHKTNPTF